MTNLLEHYPGYTIDSVFRLTPKQIDFLYRQIGRKTAAEMKLRDQELRFHAKINGAKMREGSNSNFDPESGKPVSKDDYEKMTQTIEEAEPDLTQILADSRADREKGK